MKVSKLPLKQDFITSNQLSIPKYEKVKEFSTFIIDGLVVASQTILTLHLLLDQLIAII